MLTILESLYMISVNEAAEILGMSVDVVRSFADSGRLKTFRTPGGHRRFHIEDVHKLLGTGLPKRTHCGRFTNGQCENISDKRILLNNQFVPICVHCYEELRNYVCERIETEESVNTAIADFWYDNPDNTQVVENLPKYLDSITKQL